MKLSVLGFTAVSMVSFTALEFSIAAPRAAAQTATINSSCSRLMWVGEDNAFGLDEQIFVSEADGRDRIRLSAQGPGKLLANRFYDAQWMPDGRAAMFSADGFYGEAASWIVNADGTGLRPVPESEFIETAPNSRKLASFGFNGVNVFRPNGKIIGTYSADDYVFNLKWASNNQAMAWIETNFNSDIDSLILADGLAQNTVVLATSSNRPSYDWSPDGSTIVWSDESTISRADKNGSNQQVIWSNPAQFLSWSPDGSRIAWVDGSSIRVANADGSDLIAIASTASQFEWSPNSSHIAWYDGEDLQVVNSSGGTPVVLPRRRAVEFGIGFSFSPDGNRLAWTNDDEVWISNSDGSDAFLSLRGLRDFEYLGRPIWSPDSAVFAVDTYSDIIVSNADGSASKRILSSFPNDWYEIYILGWSPCIFTPLGPTPDNDQFANAELLDGASKALASGSTFTVFGSTEEATADADEPGHAPGAFLPQGPRTSIWYRWTSNLDQIIEMDTEGSEVDTVIVAYTGNTESDLIEVATGIDRDRSVSRIRFAARAGETYHIAVDGYNGVSEGEIQLNVRQPAMDPSECTITGTNGSEILTGTSSGDIICALGGDDEIRGMGGADIIFAGDGDDFISAGSGNDIAFGEGGSDLIVGGSGEDLLSGGLRGDEIFAGEDDDIAFGGRGADRMFGSAGDDVLFGEKGADTLSGGSDNDTHDGGPFSDSCTDTKGANTFLNCE